MQGKATHKRQRLVYIDILEGGWITVQWQCRYALQAQACLYVFPSFIPMEYL